MHHRILQANLNHCRDAQNLLFQSVAEMGVDLVVAAEPLFIPLGDNWFGDTDALVAVGSVGRKPTSPQAVGLFSSSGIVGVSWGEILVVGVYFSPNRSFAEFGQYIDGLGALIGQFSTRPVMVLGDLNARSMAWGDRVTTARGKLLEDWAIAAGLVVLNHGSAATCVRFNGESIVDISLASSTIAHRVRGWRVMAEVETMSDHRYIRLDVLPSSMAPAHDHRG
ncbi:uncharacterized protein LOC128200421 [Galleria mellonella]|uniref:Uncharacterized protein LOC128200421 n=1 Tax=Galleria mellonella TaxID=7137 RepID=A0ABM3MEE6_GALME|nr:uncharacterized protein LOC128200421 [Galleria mellonella]